MNKNNSALGVSSLVLGILSILSTFFYYISLPCGILAIILGSKASKKYGSKLGKAGVVLGIIGISICAFIYISCMFILMLEAL